MRGNTFFGKRAAPLLAALLLFAAACGPQQKIAMNDAPVTPIVPPAAPPAPNLPELEKFIFRSDTFTNQVVPRRLDPAEVARFIIEKIGEDATLRQLLQTEKAAAFYDAYEVAEKFKGFVQKGASGEEAVRRLIVTTRIIARVGQPEDVEFARQYYERLATRADSIVEFEEMIALHDVLLLGTQSGTLRARIQAKIESLGARQDSDEQARLAYLKFQESIEQSLGRAEKAASVKQQILGTSNRKKRLEEEIKAYLALEYGFIEFLQPWAAMRMRRETWAVEPAAQTVRDPKPPLQADVARAFREFLGKLGSLPEDERDPAKVQILRAIKFFGGEIEEAEEAFLAQFKGEQADILADEGFLLP